MHNLNVTEFSKLSKENLSYITNQFANSKKC